MASDAVLQLMKDNQVPDNVRDYLVQTFGRITLARVHNAFEDTTIQVTIDAVLGTLGYQPAGTPAQVITARQVAGDIKQMWRECVAQNEAYIKRKASGVDDAPVGPLPPYRTMQLTTEWNARYDFELLPVWKLSPNQLGRLAREVDKAMMTLWQMSKVKTLPLARHDTAPQKFALPSTGSAQAELSFGTPVDADPEPLLFVSQYLAMLWKWCTNLAYVSVAGRTPAGGRIAHGQLNHDKPYVRWDTALHYHQYVEEKATTPLPDGHLATVSQIREADEKTRLYRMRLTGPDAPIRITLNDAIKKSLTDCHHFWQWHASQEFGTPIKRQRTDGLPGSGNSNLPSIAIAKAGLKTKDGRLPCKKWQDSRGCVAPCPDRKPHCCDVLTADNVCCGGTHKRDACPNKAASFNFRNDGK